MKLVFCPIDLDVSSITHFPEIRNNQNHSFNKYWDNEILLDEPNKWRENLHEDCNQIKELVLQLPFKELHYVRFSRQIGPVLAHKDIIREHLSEQDWKDTKNNEPCGYRIVLTGEPDTLEGFINREWKPLFLPSVPCCYVGDTTGLTHRVQDDPERCLIYVRGIVDEEKHQQLLKKSLERYGDYAVYSKG